MPTYNTQYVPLDPVESAQLNRWQRVFLTQRAPGAANSLATGLDTPDTNHTPKEVVFACGNTALAPPVTGIIDNAMDWRDREITVEIMFDPTNDIRPGEAADNAQPLIQGQFTFYSRTGARLWTTGPSAFGLGVYVDSTNGYLWIAKAAGYCHGKIRGTAQLRERS
jgi:hypothetical protein